MITKNKRILTLALALVLLFCWGPALSVSAAGAGLFDYNGTVLDRSYLDFTENGKYPYAVLRVFDDGTAVMYVTDKPCTGRVSQQLKYDNASGKLVTFENGLFVKENYYTSPIYGIGSSVAPQWANHDIPGVITGSEPVMYGSVTSIDLSRTPTQCYAGMSIGVSIDVTGTGDFEPDCVLTVTGNTSENTYVELDDRYETPNLYTLFVGADETAAQLTLTATSIANSSISASHTVSVLALEAPTDPPEPEDPEEPEDPGNEDPDETVPSPTTGDSGNDSDSEKDQFVSEGNNAADEVISIIPNESQGFLDALSSLISVLNYEGTAAVLKMPAISVPAIPGLFSEIQVMEEQELDFEYFVGLMPSVLLTIVRAMFDVAIVGYCLKELLDLIGSALTGFGGGFSKQLMEE